MAEKADRQLILVVDDTPDNVDVLAGILWAEYEMKVALNEFGAEIIGVHPSSLLRMSYTIALAHHEKWDGSGYPHGLAGKNIPLEGRIVAIADVFDALTSERPYKKAWSVEDAVKLINDTSGSHFDPSLVPLFREVMPEMLDIKDRYAEKTT